jgi:serine/threonine-protein kinase
VPPELEAVVLKCLAKAPADRFRDVRSLGKALVECDVGTEWTDEDAAAWWQFRVGTEVRSGSSECQEKAGRTNGGS